MASFGEELKRERELRDISLKEISEATKISIRFLEALEQNNFDILPGGIFNRGFVRSYARFIGVDGEEMVNAYLHEVSLREARKGQPAGGPAPQPADGAGLFRPESRRPARAETKPERSVVIPPETRLSSVSWEVRDRAKGRTSVMLWIVAVLVLVATVGVLSMSLRREPSGGLASDSHDEAVKARFARKSSTSSAASASLAPDAAASQPPSAVAPPSPGEPPAGGIAAGPAEPQRSADPNADPNLASGPVTHRLRVSATEATVIVVECAGRISLNEMLWPGASRAIDCEEPVALSADNAGAIEYSLDGAAGIPLGAVGQQVEGLTVAPPPEPARPERKTAESAKGAHEAD